MIFIGNRLNIHSIDGEKIKKVFKKRDSINISKKIGFGNDSKKTTIAKNKRFNVLSLNFEDLFEIDRPTLGRNIDILLYRALVLSIINHLGFNSPSKLYHAGMDFGKNLGVKSIDDMVYCFERLGICVPELISNDPIKIRVYECIFCSGLPNVGEPVCHFERGMLAGCLTSILNKEVKVTETKCCATGYDYCEFEVEILEKK